ncbi:uncharacterized protein DEA37_0011256 [Paragonimus westermani]|uniref:Uncharacterized protein n=1 Tax=Paragonimus westermani TaxID=34504 RepID=A0A5J4NID1_9TREM|nr:uncharacterized protein DEA37_0011256 [Paragonimus westermani]
MRRTGDERPQLWTGATSRAQRMLVLGLQKAAEQNARQKRSEPPSEPTTPDRKHSPTAVSPSVGQSLVTDSPSGIMRNFSSRKKAQRVSFAEMPVVYTFGFSESPSANDLPSSLKSHESVRLVVPTPNSTLITQNSDSVSTDLETANANSDDVAVDTQESVTSSSVVASCRPVDLDDPQSSCPSDRKSTSPQRRLIVPKAVVTSPSTVLTSLVKPVSNATSMVRLPERRRLFVSESFEVNDTLEVVSETEPDEIGIDSARSATVIVLDSEPVEITDTQPSQDNTPPDPTLKAPTILSTEEDTECMLIESSQGTQETSELQSANLSSDVRVESFQLDDAPVFALHKSALPLFSSDRPLFIPQTSDSEELVTQVPATEGNETQRNPNSCMSEGSMNDVESFIRCSLSQIASRLSSLSPTRHQSVLMEVLSTFKPIMH